jgi:hypothetical protein
MTTVLLLNADVMSMSILQQSEYWSLIIQTVTACVTVESTIVDEMHD